MPWNIRRDFHIDINASYGSYLLVSATDSSLRQPPPEMVAGDGMPVRFHFWERGPNGTITAADPGPDTSFIFSGRPAGVPAGSSLLFLTDDFTEIEAGVWEGTLDLTAAEFQAQLDAVPAGAKIILGELEVRDSIANTKRSSFQFDLTARPQVYQGEAPPFTLATGSWLLGTTAPVNESVEISGTITPAAGGSLKPVAIPTTALYPGKKQWSTDGNADKPGTGTWATVWTGLLKTPVAATLDDIVPPGNYLATTSLSTASQVQVLELGVGWKTYWLRDAGGGDFWWVEANSDLADRGATSIPAGRLIWPTTRMPQATFIGGLGEEWETAPAAEFLHYLKYFNGQTNTGNWWHYGASPFSGTYAAQSGSTGAATAALVSTTPAPPVLRVAGGYLYLQEAGVWKKIPLQDLSAPSGF